MVAIGLLEHPRCVRGIGKFVGINQFFDLLSTHHSKAQIIEEVIMYTKEEIRQEIKEEMREDISEFKKEYCDMWAQLRNEYSDVWA